jgi:hypothetical protein
METVMMVDYISIPLAGYGQGFAQLVVRPNPYGDPHSLCIEVPPECNGVLHLPRSLLREIADYFPPEE